MKTKICSKCKIPKLVNEFSKNRSRKDGLAYRCKKCENERRVKYDLKEYQKEYQKKYRQRNKKQRKLYCERNKDKISKQVNEYQKQNRNKMNKYQRERFKSDPVYRLNRSMSRDVSKSLKGDKNGHSWNKLVGYDTQELKRHLEKQFRDGMTWENYGKWHIDHRIPVSLFNIQGIKSKGFKRCWALENLQPLWAKDNHSKSNKLFI